MNPASAAVYELSEETRAVGEPPEEMKDFGDDEPKPFPPRNQDEPNSNETGPDPRR